MPTISLQTIDKEKFFNAGTITKTSDTSRGINCYIISDINSDIPRKWKETIDVAALVKKATGTFDKNNHVILQFSDSTTGLLRTVTNSSQNTYVHVIGKSKHFNLPSSFTIKDQNQNPVPTIVVGSEGNNVIHNMLNHGGNDIFFGGAGKDKLTGYDGNDTLNGGDDNDQLSGGAGDDILNGGDGDDTLTGQSDNNILNGGPGNDTFNSGYGNNTYNGGTGDDIFNIGYFSTKTNILNGGKDDDIYNLKNPRGKTIINDPLGNNQVFLSISNNNFAITKKDSDLVIQKGGFKLTFAQYNSDNFSFYTNTDYDYGDQRYNLVPNDDGTYKFLKSTVGGPKNDTIIGGDKDDHLYGEGGNDELDGNGGHDKLYGDKGHDTLVGGDGDDTLSGGEGHDSLIGGKDNDDLRGGSGNDTAYGNIGNDSFIDGAGNDTFHGGEGNDTVYDEIGDDTFYGGEDNDTYNVADSFLYRRNENNTIWDTSGRNTVILPEYPQDLVAIKKKGGNLVIQDKNTKLTILDYDAKNFSFYSNEIISYSPLTKQKYQLSANNDGTYKFLASK